MFRWSNEHYFVTSAWFLQRMFQSEKLALTKVERVEKFFWSSHQNADSLKLPESVFTFDATSNSKPFHFVILVKISSLLLLVEIVRNLEVGYDFETHHFDSGIRQLVVLIMQRLLQLWIFHLEKKHVFLPRYGVDTFNQSLTGNNLWMQLTFFSFLFFFQLRYIFQVLRRNQNKLKFFERSWISTSCSCPATSLVSSITACVEILFGSATNNSFKLFWSTILASKYCLFWISKKCLFHVYFISIFRFTSVRKISFDFYHPGVNWNTSILK